MFDPYHKWLGIAPKDQPPTLYRLLGIDRFEPDPEVIDAAANRLMAWLQEVATGEHGEASQKLLNEIAAARVRLLNAASKAEYDRQLRRTTEQASEPLPDSKTTTARATQKSAPDRRPAESLLPADVGPVRPRRDSATSASKHSKAAHPEKHRAGGSRTHRSSHPSGVSAILASTTGKVILGSVGFILLAAVAAWVVMKDQAKPTPQRTATTSDAPAKAKANVAERSGSPPPGVPNRMKGVGVYTGRSTATATPATETPPTGETAAMAAPVATVAPAPLAKAAGASQVAATGRAAADPVSAPTLVIDDAGTLAPPVTDFAARAMPVAEPLPDTQKPPPAKAAATAPAKPGEDRRVAVPDAAAQQKAREQLAELFVAEAKGKGRDAQQQYVAALFEKEPQMAADPTSLYVLLCEARDRAAQLPDVAQAEKAVDGLIARFRVNPLDAKTELLEKLLGSKNLAADVANRCADDALSLSEEAIFANAFPAAEKLDKLASQFATKGRDAELKKEANRRAKELPQLAERAKSADQARERLAKNDDDADAHLALGRYLCFVRDDWEAGLGHLAKTSNDGLKQLAGKSLEEMNDPARLVALGDAWKKLSGQKSLDKDLKPECLLVARHCYLRAQPWLVGLAKATCDKRLAELSSAGSKSAGFSHRPPPLAEAPFDAATAQKYRQRWAQALNALPLGTNSAAMKLVLIPPGEFRMGMDATEIEPLVAAAADLSAKRVAQGAAPRHRVRITHPFYISTSETTVGQFRAFATATGYKTTAETDGKGGFSYAAATPLRKPDASWQNPGYEATDDDPVVNVSYADVESFCQWLSRQEGITYRLPTEAEWEYVCRAGSDTPYPFGTEPSALSEYASSSGQHPVPIGKKLPNAFNIYDMLGNVREWCSDWYSDEYYGISPPDNPQGPTSSAGGFRVVRGSPGNGRTGARGLSVPLQPVPLTGFRVVRVQPDP